MATPVFNSNINIPQGPFIDNATGRPTAPWLLWLQYPNQVGANYANPLGISSGGTQVSQAPQAGQVLIGGNGTYQLGNIQSGQGVQVTNADGSITIDTSAVLTVSGGTTGMTFSETSDGQSTMAGVLKAVNGGTGQSTYAKGDIIYASSTNVLSKLGKPSTTSFLSMDSSGVPSWSSSTGGVTTFSGGTTGLTPATATSGAITLGGVLAIANGGTGTSVAGATGSFTTVDSKTVTVVNGFITSIV